MWYTHLKMTAPATTDGTTALDALDDALVGVRRLLLRPGYRARLLDAVGAPVELGTLRVLRTIERADDGAPCVGDVADALGVDPSTASRLVDQQVAAGHLAREQHPRDRRRTQLALTAAGQDLLDRVSAARRGLLAEVTADWPADDVHRLVELLDRLTHAFDRLEPSP